MTTQATDAVVDENEQYALAMVLAPAHRKLRRGSKDPDDPGGPNSLCMSIARALLEKRVVNVEVEVDDG